ncbi:MAG TPA: NIPSNAP family protein [Candidatus Acidoferrum sp.]|nr:NIPSNAP family protein [Candidatus Acidoferrum sp.]
MITELRRYRIKPDRLESWLAFFLEAAREHDQHGIRVEYAGVDRETNTFVWLRSFEDEADRVARKEAFYGAHWWVEREAFVMDHVIEYEVTFLDAAVIRDGGEVSAAPWPAEGEPAGSHADGPPDGWVRSARATFVPIRETRPAPG